MKKTVKESKWKKKRNKRLYQKKRKKGVFNFVILLFIIGLFTFLVYSAVQSNTLSEDTFNIEHSADDKDKAHDMLKAIPLSTINFEEFK